jgi:hypothetical protein
VTDPLLVRALLACYPAGWRRRYGSEYAALLADSLPTTSRTVLVADSLRGALDARLTFLGVAMRSPLTAAIWATGLFTVAGIGFQKLSERVGGGGTRAAFGVLVVAAAVALAGIIAIAMPALAAMLHGRGTAAWRYPVIAVAAIAAWFGILVAAKAIADDHPVHSTATVTAAVLIIGAGLAVVATVAWAANATLHRVEAHHPRSLPAAGLAVLAGGMAVATSAGVAWGIVALHTQVVDRSHGGALSTPFLPSWIGAVLLMAVATAMATAAAHRRLTVTPGQAPPTIR